MLLILIVKILILVFHFRILIYSLDHQQYIHRAGERYGAASGHQPVLRHVPHGEPRGRGLFQLFAYQQGRHPFHCVVFKHRRRVFHRISGDVRICERRRLSSPAAGGTLRRNVL